MGVLHLAFTKDAPQSLIVSCIVQHISCQRYKGPKQLLLLQSCSILFNLVQSCSILFSLVQFCSVLFGPVQSCLVLFTLCPGLPQNNVQNIITIKCCTHCCSSNNKLLIGKNQIYHVRGHGLCYTSANRTSKMGPRQQMITRPLYLARRAVCARAVITNATFVPYE